MKKIFVVCLMSLLFLKISAQETPRRLEFGSTLFSLNSFNFKNTNGSEKSPYDLLNGVFFRYTKNKMAFRLLSNYASNTVIFNQGPQVADGMNGDYTFKDFKIGLGIQHSLSSTSDLLYAFFDGYFHNTFTTGHQYGDFWGQSFKYTRTSNGFDCNFGFGAKIKLVKNLFLSPEIGLYESTSFSVENSTYLNGGSTSKFRYTESDIHPAFKMHLTARF